MGQICELGAGVVPLRTLPPAARRERSHVFFSGLSNTEAPSSSPVPPPPPPAPPLSTSSTEGWEGSEGEATGDEVGDTWRKREKALASASE